MFELLIFVAAIFSSIIAAVSGFGIGSILTPIFATKVSTKVAVAAVAIPHFVATLWRFMVLRHHVDRTVLLQFGLLSAAGGLFGALLSTQIDSDVLTIVFGLIVFLSGLTGLFDLSKRLHFSKTTGSIAGVISGLLGGLVGNQGGIRAGALLSYDISKESFVATATAVGVVVDLARLPIYLAAEPVEISSLAPQIGIAMVGCVIGTVIGMNALKNMSPGAFRKVVSVLVMLLGAYMCIRGVA